VRDDSGGAFSIDFLAGWGLFILLLAVAFYFAISSIAHDFTASYASALRPLAGEVSDMLVLSQGLPPEWHVSPSLARGASFIGLSDGRPCFITEDKVYALGFFNETELASHLDLDDSENSYGVRIEVSADDGSIQVASGYIIDDGTMDVCKCVRLLGIVDADGVERSGKLVLYLWRKHEGTAATYS
jgi:hypothetical protein